MNKVKFLTVFGVVMLIANISLLWFQFTHHSIPKHDIGPKKIIAKKLHFNKEQEAAYDKLIIWHQQEIKKYDAQIRDNKNKLFATLSNDKEVNKDSFIHLINTAQWHIEQTHYQHFRDLKALCKPEQLDKFKDLTTELGRLFGTKPPMKR